MLGLLMVLERAFGVQQKENTYRVKVRETWYKDQREVSGRETLKIGQKSLIVDTC